MNSLLEPSLNDLPFDNIYTSPQIKKSSGNFLPAHNETLSKGSLLIRENYLDEDLCELMNEFYHSSVISEDKINTMLNIIKSINNSKTANSIFISMFHNIQSYMREIRGCLYKKLKLLGLDKLAFPIIKKTNKGTHLRRYSDSYICDSSYYSYSWNGNNILSDSREIGRAHV